MSIYSLIVRADNTPQTLPFSQNWTNTGLITTSDIWSGVPGIEGYFLRNDGTSTTAVDPQTILGDTFGTGTTTVELDVNANRNDPNTFATGGTTEFDGIANPVVALSGSGTADAPFIIINLNTTGFSNVNVAYNLRDIDGSADNAVQPVALQYRVGSSGNYTNLAAGFVADATSGPSLATLVTPVSVTLPAAAENKALVQLRIMTTNAAGNDEWVGIDDISITAGGGNMAIIPNCPTSLSTTAGTPTSGNVSATDADGTVTGASITSLTPSNPGTITLDTFLPAPGVGGTATATLNVGSGTPAGIYNVTLTWTNNDVPTPQTATCSVMVTVIAAGNTLIHDIQGTAETPNFAGESRTIQGIVVGDFQNPNGLGGFFVEEEQADWDADDNTSEGIFVFDGAGSVAVNVGDKVTVTGTVLNFGGPPGLTELSPVTSVVVNSTGNPLPPVKTVALPVTVSFASDFEKYEGMRVQFEGQTLYVTDNADLGSFGELSLSANSALYIPTNSIDPNDNPASGTSITGNSNVPAVTAQQTANNNNRIILDDGRSGSNLAPLAFIGAGTNSTIRRGDTVANLAGVLSYGFGSYRIEPTGTVSFNAVNPRPASPDSVGNGSLRVASFNVENYFATTGTGRGPDNATELMRKRAKVAAAIVGLNADVVGLIELEKGTQATPDAAVNDIVAAVNAIVGAGTYAAIPTPTAVYTVPVGTDVDIKSGMIYRTTTLTTIGASLTDTTAAVGAYSRAPIAQTFQQTSNSEKFTVVVNHFRSKSCPGTGDDADMGDGQACFNGRRRSQAQAMVAFVNTTLVPVDPDVLVVGDLNAYAQEDPIDVFRGAGFSDVLDQYVAASNQYSFLFSGETGRLDHAFATNSLNSKITGATIWHINTDEPTVFDYNTENKPDDRYAPTPYASADHDPILVGINLGGICPTIMVSPSSVPSGTAGSAYGPVQFMQEGGSGTITWSVSSNNLPAGLTLNSMTGQLSGTPTVAVGVNVIIRATDSNNCFGEVTVTLQINCPTITISPAGPALPNGTIGSAYSQQLTANNASGTVNFTLQSGSFPVGITMSLAGLISGIPTATGMSSFTVLATDANNCTAMQAYSLTIDCQTITVSPAGPALPPGRSGTPYSQMFTQTGGIGTTNFSISAGTLPMGLTLTGGVLSGTPTEFGNFGFTVRATDSNNCFGERAYTLVINPPCEPITVTPATLPNGFVGGAYNAMLSATGGTPAYTFTVSAGSLPGGVMLSTGGALSGTPTTAGTFNFTIQAADATSCLGTQVYTVIISGNGLQFYPLPSPVRLLDTRTGFTGCTTGIGTQAAGSTRTQPARTVCSTIPDNAMAVIGNITVVPTGPGYLTLFPSDATQPTVANSNFKAGEITNNFFTVGLGTSGMDAGAFKIFTSAETHVIIDLTGYYAPPGNGGLFYHPLPSPVRLVETRSSFSGCFQPSQLIGTGNPNADPNLDLAVQGRSPSLPSPCNSIPSDATVLVGNATTVLPSGLGYLTIYPSDATRPTVASSNYAGSDVINGPFAVKLGADGKFKVYTFSTTDLVVDITGYYSASPTDANGTGLLFNPLPTPMRLLETRPDFPSFPLTGCYRTNAPIAASPNIRTQNVWGMCSDQPITIPNTARAIVGNATIINPVAAGFLTFFPGDAMTAPTVATSNYPFPVTFGYNRHYYVGLSPADGTFKILSQFTTDLIVDVSGYFAP